jgi:hypothetical protein
MKKILSLLIVFCVTLSSIAAPWDIKSPKINYAAWNNPLEKSRAFDDPYCDYYIGTVTGNWPAQTFNLQATLNQQPDVTWLVQIQVLGIWYGNPGYPNYADYKVFDFVYSTAQWNKTINYSLRASEEAYPGVMDIIYDGPY